MSSATFAHPVRHFRPIADVRQAIICRFSTLYQMGIVMHKDQARAMAAYNRWMNEKLFSVCADLSDGDRKADAGVFFRSIHGTLNHLLLGDRIWMGRFTGTPFLVSSLDQELYSDFSELRAQRATTDDDIENWASELTDQTLNGKLKYTSIVNPETRSYEMWVCVTHFFNHQTHHRGQLTALLSQADKDYGIADLIWLPQVIPDG